nr:hypothetical protein [Tanacetum cinerariifolium]
MQTQILAVDVKPQNFVANENVEDCQGVNKCVLGCDIFLDCCFQRGRRSKGNQESRRRVAGNTRYKARDNERRPAKHVKHKDMVTIDGKGVDWTGHAKDDTENHALMAFNSNNSGSDTEVTTCLKVCEESYTKLNKLYDEQKNNLVMLV